MPRLALILLLGLAARDAHAQSRRLGVMADLGVPDGVVTAVAYRLHPIVSAHLGLGHNTNSFGLRSGARLEPWRRAVSPYAALEGGIFFAADTASWLKDVAQSAGLEDKTLERVGYWFASAHLGARFGTGATTVLAQGGVSLIDATALYLKPKPNFVPPVDLYREVEVRVLTLSGHLGILHTF